MSPRSWQERVEDVLAAIAEIETFLKGMTKNGFLSDLKTIRAVVADLTVIGEAARHIPDVVVQAHSEIPWALMTGMRNRIVHGYYQVDPTIVWETCQNDRPPLVELLNELIRDEASDAPATPTS